MLVIQFISTFPSVLTSIIQLLLPIISSYLWLSFSTPSYTHHLYIINYLFFPIVCGLLLYLCPYDSHFMTLYLYCLLVSSSYVHLFILSPSLCLRYFHYIFSSSILSLFPGYFVLYNFFSLFFLSPLIFFLSFFTHTLNFSFVLVREVHL